ncbi:MAG: hypothetical protein GY711_33870 [bacterium]|nr:hypothetical protein [bacterium]
MNNTIKHSLLILALSTLTAGASTAQSNRIMNQQQGAAGSRHGISISRAGDFNNDGRADYVVGADLDTTAGVDAGRVTVVSGASNQILAAVSGQGSYFTCTFPGTLSGDRLGNAVGAAGDVNGDGFDDVIVGAPFASRVQGGTCRVNSLGEVQVLAGPSGTSILTLTGTSAFNLFGAAVAGAGDLTGNGNINILVGQLNRVTVFDAVTGAVVRTHNNVLGLAVSSAGDFDGDGDPDYACSAPNGRVRVFDGMSGAQVATWTGFDNRYGEVLSLVGDIDGDGESELAVSSPFALGGLGLVEVRDNSNVLAVYTGLNAGENMGLKLGAGEDVDGDGVPDVVATGTAGPIRVLNGATGTMLRSIPFVAPTGQFSSVDVIGDADGNGIADIAAGNTGTVRSWIYSGGPDLSLVSVGAPCGTVATLPSLTVTGTPTPGANIVFNVVGGPVFRPGALLIGADIPGGTLIGAGPCRLFTTGFINVPFTTNVAGSWNSGNVLLPSDFALVGFPLTAQAATLSTSTSFEVTNAVQIAIGW